MENTLNLILQELKGVNGRLDSLEQGQKALEQGQKALEQRMASVENRMTSLEQGQQEIRKDLAELKESHLELPSGLIDNFGIFNKSIEELIQDRTYTLNKRLYDVESDIQKIMRLQKIV
ncbi:hypothetical protein [Sporosarcina sp. FSL K6-3457]|uniref:hypothetical protein n=1 Tax=Sporosarcina sp. FSL K6-3457 TaxID=2978204 RepID=UPI0030F6A08B